MGGIWVSSAKISAVLLLSQFWFCKNTALKINPPCRRRPKFTVVVYFKLPLWAVGRLGQKSKTTASPHSLVILISSGSTRKDNTKRYLNLWASFFSRQSQGWMIWTVQNKHGARDNAQTSLPIHVLFVKLLAPSYTIVLNTSTAPLLVRLLRRRNDGFISATEEPLCAQVQYLFVINCCQYSFPTATSSFISDFVWRTMLAKLVFFLRSCSSISHSLTADTYWLCWLCPPRQKYFTDSGDECSEQTETFKGSNVRTTGHAAQRKQFPIAGRLLWTIQTAFRDLSKSLIFIYPQKYRSVSNKFLKNEIFHYWNWSWIIIFWHPLLASSCF